MKNPYYRITTWDPNRQTFTPQTGVRAGRWSLWGLRKPLRLLRSMGYDASHKSPCVLVERIDP